VNLTEEGELAGGGEPLKPYHELLIAEAQDRGLSLPEHHRFEIPDTYIIDDAGYDQILEYIRQELDSGKIVYVHCWGGKGRTSTVVGCLLIDDGLDYAATIARIAELRAGTGKAIDPVPRHRGAAARSCASLGDKGSGDDFTRWFERITGFRDDPVTTLSAGHTIRLVRR
jgi:hypothetical protein